MRKSKFSESQIVEILEDAESRVPVADLLRKHSVSKATFFKWRSKYGGASVSDVKRLRELEVENARLSGRHAGARGERRCGVECSGRLAHRAKRVLRVADPLENLVFERRAVRCRHAGHETRGVLEHVQ